MDWSHSNANHMAKFWRRIALSFSGMYLSQRDRKGNGVGVGAVTSFTQKILIVETQLKAFLGDLSLE